MGRASDRLNRYSDGEAAERDLLAAMKSADDVTLESEELQGKVKDIASYYHLGIGRSAVLRCLDLPVESRVLELGAGCGAITRYLGETFSSVHAIEPSPIRAEIARERCRDLENVSISCSDARNERFDSDYDVVVIIGVLEYAPVFIYPEEAPRDACLRFLKLARNALNDDGNLVLAIENRIGLDYWAGAPENHTGRPYDGVHDYPDAGSPVTFTRTELQELLSDAGFAHTAFYHCFPDYHYSKTILSSTGEARDYFLHNWIDFPNETPANRGKTTFNRSLAARALSGSGMLREFSNGFLVVGGCREVARPDWVAKRYSMRRKQTFRIVTTLVAHPEPRVIKTALHPIHEDSSGTQSNRVRLRTGDADWKPGDLLTFEIERAALGRGFSEYLAALFSRYDAELKKRYGTGERDAEGYPMLGSDSLDAVFANIIQDEAGDWHFIDEEWQTESNLPVDFVLYRCIRFCLFNLGIRDAQARKMIRSLYPSYGSSRHGKNRVLADRIQGEIVLQPISPKLLRKNLLGRVVRSEVIRPYVEKAWFRVPHSIRSFIRKRLL